MAMSALRTTSQCISCDRKRFGAIQGDQRWFREDSPRRQVPSAFQGIIHSGKHGTLGRGHEIEPCPDLMITGNVNYPKETVSVTPPFGLFQSSADRPKTRATGKEDRKPRPVQHL